jgi:hypothetical protein
MSKDIQVYKDRYTTFKNYCLNNKQWLEQFPLPFITPGQKKETVFIEFRNLEHNYFVIRNTIRVLGNGWSHTIVCGESNYSHMCEIRNKIGRAINIIKLDCHNMTRLKYSLLLLKSSFWEKFKGDFLLIYQEDSIIFKDIPNFYFHYDFVGAPFPNKTVGNGGLSLRNKHKMIEICNSHYDSFEDKFEKARSFLEFQITTLENRGIDYKKDNRFLFLYQIEKSILEDVLLCKYIHKLPSFLEAMEFSVEKHFFKTPIGGHQFWYAINNVNYWLDINLKKIRP